MLLLCVTTAVADSDKTSLRKMWASSHYATNSVPAAWRPAKIPTAVSDVGAFERYSIPKDGACISRFIARFGMPSRYLTTKRAGGQDFLIYDLPSGHAVALYVYKPPGDHFGACVIITSDGSLVKLIK
jgi:hypothetical protein